MTQNSVSFSSQEKSLGCCINFPHESSSPVNSCSMPFRFFLSPVALNLQANMQVELNPLLFVAITIFLETVYQKLSTTVTNAYSLFTNMRILKFKSQLTIAFFAAVNHLNGPLDIYADLDGTIFAYNYHAGLACVMTFDNPHAHGFHLRHPKISQAMLRKWPMSGSCRPWFLAFYVKKKERRDEGKGKFGNGTGYKEDGEKVH